jgi:hypothetical protein
MKNHERLRQLIDGYRDTALVYVATKLGLPDLLARGAMSLEELARRLEVDDDRLNRLLRGLAVIGIVNDGPGHTYALTELGSGLCSQSPGGLGAAALIAGEEYAPAWGDLLHSVRSGEVAFEHVFGMTAWAHRAQNPELNRAFQIWLREATASSADSVSRAYDFSDVKVVADIGGGQGGVLRAILAGYPGVSGVLVDLPHVIAQAGPLFEEAGLSGRYQLKAADFFNDVPGGADLYLLKSVLHDWNDEQCLTILRTCRKAMQSGTRLLIVERVLPERAIDSPSTIMLDLHMMAVLGGRERSLADYRRLAAAAGLELRDSLPTDTGFRLMEYLPA